MRKKLTALILVVALLLISVAPAAVADSNSVSEISSDTARNIATFYLATMPEAAVEGIEEPVKLGKNFDLLDGMSLYDTSGQVAYICYPFVSTAVSGADGYITISLFNDEPYVSECVFGDVPYTQNTIYLSHGTYFIIRDDNTIVSHDGVETTMLEVKGIENAIKATREENAGWVTTVFQLNDEVVSALNKTTLIGFLNNFNTDTLKAYLEYYFGRVYFWSSSGAEQDEAIENFIRESTDEIYVVTESSGVDKNFIKPHTQSYYYADVPEGDGICGKASIMMMLAFYRDAKGFDNLPDDETMYDEFSSIYKEMNEKYSFIFDNETIREKFGFDNSFEIYFFLDTGLAEYLYSKGYKQEAANVLANMTFSVPFLSSAEQKVLFESFRGEIADMILERTDGKLNLPLSFDVSAADVVIRSLKRGEPAVIGNLWAVGSDSLTNHYFTAVTYYKLEYQLKLWGVIPYGNVTKEYVECYDTWSSYSSSIIDWSVFNITALYSANSLAELH